jgi:hypothetical protein
MVADAPGDDVAGTCPWRRSRSSIEPGAFLVEVQEAMSTRKFLLPLAGLLAIGLAIAGWKVQPAQATPGAIQVTQINATTYTVVATYTDDTPAGSTAAVLAATTSTAGIFFGTPTIQPLNGEAITGVNTAALSITEDADAVAAAKTVTATFTCTSTVQTAFTLTHGGSSITSQFICAGGTPGSSLQVSPPTQQINLSVAVTGICSPGLALTANPANIGVFQNASGATVTNLTTVSCGSAGSQVTATFFCTAPGNVTFSLGTQTGTLTCGTTTTAGIIATPPSVAVNQTATISGNCVGSQQVTSSAGGQFQSVINGASYNGPNAITCAGGTFSATFLCGPAPATITFTSGLQTGTLGCGVAAVGGLTLNPPGSGATTVVSGQCLPGQQLTVVGPGSFIGAQINGVQVPNVAGATVVNCASAGGVSAQFNCTTIGTANFNLAGLVGTFSCTTGTGGTCPGGGIFNPATGGCAASGGVPSSIAITANPSSLQCTGASSVAFMSVTVKDAQGQNVQDGTNVTITADSGTFAPSQATTLGGMTQFIYSPASTSSGTVNIRANAGSAQGTGSVNVSCSGSSTTPPPVSAPVTSPPPPPSGPVTIQPPNTGDAGLAKDTHTDDWQLYAATSILVAMAAGAIALVRAKA